MRPFATPQPRSLLRTPTRVSTCVQVLLAMHRALEQATGGGGSTGVADMVFGLLLGGGMTSGGQTPVLSCDRPMDINTRLLL